MPTEPIAETHHQLVRDVAGLRLDRAGAAQIDALGLHLTHVSWEDTARFKGSAVGPNISDMTIEVESRRQGQRYATCMPVLRFPNFTDRSADVPLDAIELQVGNHRGEPLRTIGLRAYLGDLRAHLSDPHSWAGAGTSLLAERDSHVLVSAQACFLPVPRAGLASFTPVIFNYQSRAGDPAVLAILATREGTSATVVDNLRDRTLLRGAGQRLFFNANGQRAPFTGARASESLSPGTGPRAAARASAVLLIQVPLKQGPPPDRSALMEAFELELERGSSGVEPAIIGHGASEGPYVEIAGLAIERDPRYPIRVTVQFYQATCAAELDEDALVELGAQIERVYADASAVGSLVDAGATGRVTEWDDEGAGKQQPPGWWGGFWRRYAAQHGLPVAESLEAWVRAEGPLPASPEELARRLADLSS